MPGIDFPTTQFGLDVEPGEWAAAVNQSIAEKAAEYAQWQQEIGFHTATICRTYMHKNIAEQLGTIIVPVSLCGSDVEGSVLSHTGLHQVARNLMVAKVLTRNAPCAFRPRPGKGIAAFLVTRDAQGARLEDSEILAGLARLESEWAHITGKARGLLSIPMIGAGGSDYKSWWSGFGRKVCLHAKSSAIYQGLFLNEYRSGFWRHYP